MTKAKGKAEAKTKASTKAPKAKLTPKQMSVKAASLLKGIDNSVTIIDKHRTNIVQSAGQLAGILSGLSNAATAVPAPAKKTPVPAPAKKAQAKAQAKKAQTSAKKPAAKAPAKKPAAKLAAKAEKKAAEKPTGQKPPVANRPTVKEAIGEVITKGGPDSRAALYHKVTDKYGYWSRQSFYNALKDKKSFKEIGDGKIDVAQTSAQTKTTDAEAAKFVEKVAGDATVSNAT